MREDTPFQRELWIDGLRGVAALAVAFFHYSVSEIPSFYRSYWSDPPEENRRLYQLLPLRAFVAGPAMVRLFFVISGYSLAIGLPTIRRLRGLEDDELRFYKKLSSAVFRRGLRLFIPLAIWSGICHILFYAGAQPGEPYSKYCPNARPFPASPLPLVWCYMGYLVDAINFLDTDKIWNLGFNNTLWSISFEFRGSLAVWIMLLGLARLRPNVRLTIIAISAALWWWSGTVEMPGFAAGLFMAEAKKMLSACEVGCVLPGSNKECDKVCWKKPSTRTITIVSLLALFLGLYLMSLPGTETGTIPPDYTFFFSSPRWEANRFAFSYHHIGASLLVASLLGLPSLRGALETRIPQFLGTISFALFLVHYAVYNVSKRCVLILICWLLGANYDMISNDGSMPNTLLATKLLGAVVEGTFVLFLAVKMTPLLDQRPRAWAMKMEKMLAAN